MGSKLQFSLLLLLLPMMMMTVCAALTTIVTSKFKKLEIGENIRGTVETETATSKLQCSNRYHELDRTVVVTVLKESKTEKFSLQIKEPSDGWALKFS